MNVLGQTLVRWYPLPNSIPPPFLGGEMNWGGGELGAVLGEMPAAGAGVAEWGWA